MKLKAISCCCLDNANQQFDILEKRILEKMDDQTSEEIVRRSSYTLLIQLMFEVTLYAWIKELTVNQPMSELK
jgi:hypothetical protein